MEMLMMGLVVEGVQLKSFHDQREEKQLVIPKWTQKSNRKCKKNFKKKKSEKVQKIEYIK